MRLRVVAVVAFVAGILIGVVATVAVRSRAEHRKVQDVLTTDLDLGKSYFFSAPSPLNGIVRQGSIVEVEWRYSNADYVAFRTVIDHAMLQRSARSK